MPQAKVSQIKPTVVLAAGGTGGHLFPAQALAEVLTARGVDVHLMSDSRVRDYGQDFPATAICDIAAAAPTPGKPWRLPRQLATLWRGFLQASRYMTQLPNGLPGAVIGFGGYPSVPPIFAAARLGIPRILHEQNAVMGRANRLLAVRSDAIASSFPEIVNLPAAARDKIHFTGNPVRESVLSQAQQPYQPPDGGGFNLLVFGGSQGARYFSELMPKVLAALPDDTRTGLKLTQQCRKEDIDQVRRHYSGLGLDCELATFFADMPARIAGAHLVICRSGASSVAELAVIGRPSILVPLPHSLDNDQLRNAQSLHKAGGCWVMQQSTLEARGLAALISQLHQDSARLAAAAAAAKAFGQPRAAEQLADLVEQIALQQAKG